MKIPKGWKKVALGDIMTREQGAELCNIMNRPHKTQQALIDDLKKYLLTIKDSLDKKGVDPCYLAYYLANADAQKRRQVFRNN